MPIEFDITNVSEVKSVEDVKNILASLFFADQSPRMLFDHLRDKVALRIYAESHDFGVSQVAEAWFPFARTYRLSIKPSVWTALDEWNKQQQVAKPKVDKAPVMPGIFATLAVKKDENAETPVASSFEKLLRSY